MSMPKDVPIIDAMLSVPTGEQMRCHDFVRSLLRDEESLRSVPRPVQVRASASRKQGDCLTDTLDLMDRYGIERAMTGVPLDGPGANNNLAVKKHPDRFIASVGCHPSRGLDGVRDIVRAHEEFGVRAVSAFPAGNFPQIPIRAGRWRPSASSRWTRSAGASRSCAACSGTARSRGRRSRSSGC